MSVIFYFDIMWWILKIGIKNLVENMQKLQLNKNKL